MSSTNNAESEVPTGWSVTELSHVVPKVQYGISSSLDDGKGIPVLRMNNLHDGLIDISDVKFSTSPGAEKLLLQLNDVLFNRTNSMEHVGRASLWRGELPKASFASYLVRLIPDPSRLDAEYLVRWLNLPEIQIAIRCFATPGVHQVNINPTNLRKTAMRLPEDVREQKRINRILTTVDNLIEKTEALIAKYQAIKQGMMHDLFTRGVDDRGHLRPPYEEAPALYKRSELGWIPKEWSVVSARNICHEITKGATPPQMYDEPGLSNVPFIRVQNLSFDGTLLFDDQELFIPDVVHQTSLVRSKVFPGDVLMNLVGPPMGKVSFIPDTFPEWNINQAIAIFRTLDASANVFLSHFLLSQFAFKWFISRAKRTSGQTNITLEMCRQLPVPIADDEDERIRITGFLNNADARLVSERAVLNKLHRLKTGLMQDLLTGKIRVKVDEAEGIAVHV
jgi:type I restriction enzyme S subunit